MLSHFEKTTAVLLACTLMLATWLPVITVPAAQTQAEFVAPALA